MSTGCNISLTESALRKIRSLVEQEGDGCSVLRVAVLGGGCSGFKYDFLMDQVNKKFLDDDFNHDDCRELYGDNSNKDIVISDENGNPVLMIDDFSAKLLDNSTIDYTEDLSGSGFQVRNALAKSRCGCGNSFSV